MAAYMWLAMAVMWIAWLGFAMVVTVVVTLVSLWLAMVSTKMATTDDLFQVVIAEFLYHKILIH
jgi:ammonia channel protein AmtB